MVDWGEPSELAKTVVPGRYRHFKGGEYDVLGVGRMSEDHAQEVVIYRSLKFGTIKVRPLDMFLEVVDKPEYHYHGPRFVRIESSKEADESHPGIHHAL